MLHITLALLSLVSATVQLDFQITNSRQNELARGSSPLGQLSHKVVRRDAGQVGTGNSSANGTSSANNGTVQPVINASLTTSYNFYHGKLLVGKPAQELDVLLDTGSPVSWVYGPQGSFNNATQFFPNRSTTFEDGNTTFSAEYGSGEYLGHWATDLVSASQFVAANTTHNTTNNSYAVPFEFGIVSSFATAAGAPGLLGLGPHIQNAGPSSYISLPEAYKKYNVTSSSAFSIFLEETAGRFLFGGVDLEFAKLPLYRFTPYHGYGSMYGGNPTSWTVLLETVKLNNNDPYLVRGQTTLDTGSPISLLPPGFVDQVGKALNLTSYGRYETYYVNGTLPESVMNSSITFNIGKFSVEIPVRDLMIPGELIWLDDGPQNVTALCFMGSNNYLLGDTFFRHVYTVLDPSSGDVLLSERTQARTNATIKGRNATNASTIVPFSALTKNVTAIVNGTLSVASSSNSMQLPVTSSEYPANTIARIPQNQYLGTVPADKQASMSSVSNAPSIAASATVSSTAASSASGSSRSSSASSSKSSNAAPFNSGATLGAVVGAFVMALA